DTRNFYCILIVIYYNIIRTLTRAEVVLPAGRSMDKKQTALFFMGFYKMIYGGEHSAEVAQW
ncbi:MAG: hypothetical protein UV05_C0044G0009, partial [candidate division CPR1 bacterium GW2011_GWA2_42_17]